MQLLNCGWLIVFRDGQSTDTLYPMHTAAGDATQLDSWVASLSALCIRDYVTTQLVPPAHWRLRRAQNNSVIETITEQSLVGHVRVTKCPPPAHIQWWCETFSMMLLLCKTVPDHTQLYMKIDYRRLFWKWKEAEACDKPPTSGDYYR